MLLSDPITIFIFFFQSDYLIGKLFYAEYTILEIEKGNEKLD